MLSQVRNTLRGVVAWVVIILLILAFALFGVPELTTMTRNAAVKVGNESFTSQYVQSEFTRQYNIRRQESGGSFTRDQALASGLPAQVINTMATTSALKQAAADLGLATPRSVVRDYLQQNESFQNPVTGKFDQTILEAILRNNSMTAKDFEDRISEEIVRSQLISAIVASGPTPKAISDVLLLRSSERRRIAYLTVTDEMSGVAAEPTPDDLQKYYETNSSTFTAPEYRVFDVVFLREEDFREGLEVSEEELRKAYDLNRERVYEVPERRTIYQITYDSEAAAIAAAAALRQGKPVETVAQERGLTLDAVTFTEILQKDILDPNVGAAAFAAEAAEGDILDPVDSLFGWTIVQIAGVLPPETKTFEEVRDEIEAEYLNADTRRKMLDAIDVIEEARDTGAGLVEAAAEAGLETQRFGPMDRYSFDPGGAIIDGAPGEVISEVFQLEEGEESEALQLTVDTGYFVVAVDEVRAPALKDYELVADEVEQLWRKDERASRISQAVNSLRDAIEGGESFEDAAARFNRTPIVSVIDRRASNDAISASMRDQIFFTELNELTSGPVALGESQVIAQVREIGYGRNAVPPQEVANFSQYLGFQYDQELLEAFVGELRDQYGVRVNQAQIDALFTDVQ